MNSILTLRSAVIIALCAIICSCSKKIHLSSVQQAPAVKQKVITNVNANSTFKENFDDPSSVIVSPTEVAVPSKQPSALKTVQPGVKKFTYKSGYRPEIFKPRPFVPEVRYTIITNEDKPQSNNTANTVFVYALAFTGALVLIPLAKRWL